MTVSKEKNRYMGLNKPLTVNCFLVRRVESDRTLGFLILKDILYEKQKEGPMNLTTNTGKMCLGNVQVIFKVFFSFFVVSLHFCHFWYFFTFLGFRI